MAREIIIALRVTAEERAKVEALAAAEGRTISDFLRRCIIFSPTPKTPQPNKQAA